MTYLSPFTLMLDMATGSLQPRTSRVVRRVSDLRGYFADRDATATAVAAGDPVVYEVEQYDLPEEAGQLICCTTVLYPGVVGEEYYMTKGHFHAVRATAEVYLGLSGEGYLLLVTEDGAAAQLRLGAGTVAYVPPYWAHRTVNTGEGRLAFLAVYPAHAGHDYATARTMGFGRRVLRGADGPVLA